jgi:3-deoxy-D-manno-octulosonic-acid transferase
VGDAIEALLADDTRRAAMTAAGMELVTQGRGALARTLGLVGRDLPRKPA